MCEFSIIQKNLIETHSLVYKKPMISGQLFGRTHLLAKVGGVFYQKHINTIMKRLFGILLLLILSTSLIIAQNTNSAAAQKELKDKGIAEDEVKKRMLQRGFDIDNINPTNEKQVLAAEKALEEVIKEIETESLEAVVNNSTEEITQAVEDGKAVDVAIAEELVKAQNENASAPPTRIYGQQIFRDKTIDVFTSAEKVKPSASYVLGSGDKVNISIWGVSQEDATYTLNSEGYIKPSQMPRISLKGKTLEVAENVLRSRYNQYYNFREEDFEVTITYSRTVTISILGEVFNSGSFTIPAVNTAFNALVASGGPTNIGSVRNIRFIRGGVPTRKIDIYEFMNDPTVQEQFYLQENDIIHVGTIGRTVKISGSVRKPFIFELTAGENLKQLLEYAGGLKDNAYQGNIRIKRFVEDKEKIIDVNLRDLNNRGQDFVLESGDVVEVQQIANPYKNFVVINGAIEFAGQFEFNLGMRVADLVRKGVLLEGARTDVAFLLRTRADGTTVYERINIEEALQNPNSPSNFVLLPKDRLRILSQGLYVDQAKISVGGSVRSPGELDLDTDTDLKLDEAIILSGGLRPDATDFAYIYRFNPENRKEQEYIRVNLRNAIENPDSPDNLKLRPKDRIDVLSKFTFTDQSFVKISGAVRNPGEYRFDESLLIKDVLTLAGGLKLQAASNRIDISRVIITENEPTKVVVAAIEVDRDLNIINGDDFTLQPYDQIIVRAVPEFKLQENITIGGQVAFPGTYTLVDANEKLLSIIKRAGGMTDEAWPEGATLKRSKNNTGFIVMKLDEVLKNPSSRYNFILKEGDVINIPKERDLVFINLGATLASQLYPDKLLEDGRLNVAHYEGKNAKWYIDEYAGGVGAKGRKSLISVEHPNGQIERTGGFIVNKYPPVEKGSVISIGVKRVDQAKEEKKKGEEIDWGKVLADSISQATAILTVILLVQRLN